LWQARTSYAQRARTAAVPPHPPSPRLQWAGLPTPSKSKCTEKQPTAHCPLLHTRHQSPGAGGSSASDFADINAGLHSAASTRRPDNLKTTDRQAVQLHAARCAKLGAWQRAWPDPCVVYMAASFRHTPMLLHQAVTLHGRSNRAVLRPPVG
jgi:hypothetical protein